MFGGGRKGLSDDERYLLRRLAEQGLATFAKIEQLVDAFATGQLQSAPGGSSIGHQAGEALGGLMSAIGGGKKTKPAEEPKEGQDDVRTFTHPQR